MRTRFVTRDSNSLRKRVSAECTGTYADGPTKQIVFILYGNGTAWMPSASLDACGNEPGQMEPPTSSSWSRSASVPLPSTMRLRILSSHVPPSRHGVHFPHDSCA